ncbi:unnamed protein product, partial [Staurois parvus]
MYKKMKFFKIYKFPAGSGARTSWCHRDRKHRSRMPASTGGDGRGCCRGHIAGAKDKLSSAGNPYAAPHGKPECSSGVTAFGTE